MSNNDIILSQIRQRLEILYQMVDELEAGGGGGGGTTNYNALTNKPSINGHTLQGNSTLDSLGIAAKSTLDAAVEELELMETEIDGKVDKVTGKGLSTNDFTNADKTDLSTALTKANAAAPQSTTYTKSEVDTALSDKVDKETGKGLSTNDFTTAEKDKLSGIEQGATKTVVDATLSSTSTNPVQNQAVQAPVARLVDAGAKNLLKITATSQTINGVTFTVNDDGTVTVNGTNTGNSTAFFVIATKQQAVQIPDGNYWLSGCPQGGGANTFDLRWWRYSPNISAYDRGSGAAVHKSGNTDESNIAIVVLAGVTVNNITFKPMLCTVEDYDVSPEFVPYAPSNRELYEKILALQG